MKYVNKRETDVQKTVTDLKKQTNKLDKKEIELLDALNTIINHSKPININKFNTIIEGKTKQSFAQLEKRHKKVTIRLKNHNDKNSGWCTSVMGLLSTITRILTDKSLMAVLDNNDNIIYFSFYELL